MAERARAADGWSVLGAPAVLLLVVLALVPRLVIAWDLPLAATPDQPECAPDEALQYWTVMRYASGDFATWPASGSIYSAYPPAPYALHAATLALARLAPGDGWPARFPSSWWRLRRYGAARLGGVLLGALTVVGAAFATATWTRSRRLALASGAALAFLPELVFVNAYVNADSFTIAAVAALVAALSAWVGAGEGRSHLVLVGAAIGLVVLGKPTGYPALVPTVVWLLDAWRRRRLAPAALGRAVMTALVVAGPLLIANALRNAGDPFGIGKYRQLIATAYDGRPIAGLGALPSFLGKLARSSFGVFRHADLHLPFGFYLGAAAALALGLGAGTVALRASSRRQDSGDVGRALGWLAASVAMSVALVVWNGLTVDAQAQGRYLLPALVPLWAAATCGLGQLGRAVLPVWVAFLAAATVVATVLVHTHACV